MQRHLHCEEQPMGCKTQWNYHIHVWKSQQVKHISCTFRAATGVHQIHKNCACHTKSDRKTSLTVRGWSETVIDGSDHDLPWARQSAIRSTTELTFRADHRKYKFHQMLPLPWQVTLQLHQVTAPARRHDCETWVLSSPSTAPATKSDLHQILHLPRKLSVQLDCNFTKYCTCHEKWPAPNFAPATKTERATWLQLHQVAAPATKSDLHQILHLPRRKLSVELDCNFTKYCTCHESDSWTAPNTAPAPTKAESWLQPNIGPATKSDSWTAPNTVPLYYSLTRAILLFYSLTLLSFDSTILWLYYSLTLLFFYSTILWIYYHFTLLFFYSVISFVHRKFLN